MALSANVTVSMPMEMVQNIDAEADALGMSRAEYIREAVRNANGTPFSPATNPLLSERSSTDNEV
ncbi:ribbon-helix-helix domain-containing protein [Halobaculum lipolyticum]|uniref:Ribbon-helix-helix domain-containing protein n=1 Tax=Halobaculum lipolyticum TaxID=3032001 RepID=A0ABD5WDU8_9EURY|nr:ribbon-helix-helix domain-containing protein [Halobaculum sp. DT31]